MTLEEEVELRVEALEYMVTVLIAAQSVNNGIPTEEVGRLMRAAYGIAEKNRSDCALARLDNMYEQVLTFLETGS